MTVYKAYAKNSCLPAGLIEETANLEEMIDGEKLNNNQILKR